MHRHNAVNVYNQMLTAVQKTGNESERETLNALLLELSKAIFDSKDTGYTEMPTSGSFPMNLINFYKSDK